MAEIGNLHAEDLQVDYEIRQGKPEQVTAETAGKLGVDLIVIFTDGKGNIKDFLTGKMTELSSTMHPAPCWLFHTKKTHSL